MNDITSTQTFAYGLVSTELHRASERRTAERQRDAIAIALRPPSRVTTMRQRLGNSMIRIGANIANVSYIEPGAHPRVEAPFTKSV